MRLYHGTSYRRADAIRCAGLRAGSFVTRELDWAMEYARIAGCRDGTPENRDGLIVTVEAAPEDLRRDPHPHARAESAAALARCLPALELRAARFPDLLRMPLEQVAEIASMSHAERLRDGRNMFA